MKPINKLIREMKRNHPNTELIIEDCGTPNDPCVRVSCYFVFSGSATDVDRTHLSDNERVLLQTFLNERTEWQSLI